MARTKNISRQIEDIDFEILSIEYVIRGLVSYIDTLDKKRELVVKQLFKDNIELTPKKASGSMRGTQYISEAKRTQQTYMKELGRRMEVRRKAREVLFSDSPEEENGETS